MPGELDNVLTENLTIKKSKELNDVLTEIVENKTLTPEMKMQRLVDYDPYSTKVKLTTEEIHNEILLIYDLYFAVKRG